jgi:hypothetical protein
MELRGVIRAAGVPDSFFFSGKVCGQKFPCLGLEFYDRNMPNEGS